MITVELKEVSKSFNGKKVLNDVNLALIDGHIYGLLGRNGSGKTTFLNLMTTRYIPDSGEVKLLDEAAYENDRVLSDICYMKDYIPAFVNMSVERIFKQAKKHYEKWNDDSEKKLTEMFEIDVKSIYGLLSKGQQTAVGFIVGIASNTRILLLDEIYSGLDTVYRKKLYSFLIEEQERYTRTIVLSSHLIDEMSVLFTDVIILQNGGITLNDDVESIERYSLRLTGRKDISDVLKSKKIIRETKLGESMKEFIVYDNLGNDEIRELSDRGYTVSSISIEDLFNAVTGEE